MSSNKGELSQLITFPAKRRKEGSLKWCETPRAISGRKGEGRACSDLVGEGHTPKIQQMPLGFESEKCFPLSESDAVFWKKVEFK